MSHLGSQSSNKSRTIALSIAAIGVVFGDIGTSPIYALRECFSGPHGLGISRDAVLGICSLLVWTIILEVCIKYIIFVLRADNKGEGGILSLISLVGSTFQKKKVIVPVLSILGVVGAALLYSDGILTPSNTILSAVEGIRLVEPNLTEYIVPITIVILVVLFAFQSHGTAKVGGLFGPILIVWFVVLAALGIYGIGQNTDILNAINPYYAVKFISEHLVASFAVFGSVFLAITGVEVLYADLGHFGKKPIRLSWFIIVFPALILNYFGQGAYLLSGPENIENLFFQIGPEWSKIPLLIIATMAAIIASQAVITGAFSLARQSVQLGYWPRMRVLHTSSETIGQVYVPFINWALMIGAISLVVNFKTSSNLASAYGIAVSTDMLITGVLMSILALRLWKWSPFLVLPAFAVFFALDLTFFSANVSKVATGGWVVVVIAFMIFLLMKTWMDGRKAVRKIMEKSQLTVKEFAESIGHSLPARVEGTGVFLAGNPNGIPIALLHNLKHNRVLHDTTVILSVQTLESPKLTDRQRYTYHVYEHGLIHVLLYFGFSETPNLPDQLKKFTIEGFKYNPMKTTYFLGRESLVIVNKKKTMLYWRKRLFGFMSHNAQNATNFFQLPPNMVVEIGVQTEL